MHFNNTDNMGLYVWKQYVNCESKQIKIDFLPFKGGGCTHFGDVITNLYKFVQII